MNILMLETHRGSEDGFVVRCFERGRVYALADLLARRFLRMGWAVEVRNPKNERNSYVF